MAKVHTLDIYPHTGGSNCLGCVDEEALTSKKEPASTAKRAPLGRARGDTRPVGAVERVDPQAQKSLFGAAWDRPTAAPGEEVTLQVRANELDGAEVAFKVFPRGASTVLAELTGSISGGVATAAWTPDDPEPGDPGELEFEAEAEEHIATSGTLALVDFIDVTIRDDGDLPVAHAQVELLLANGKMVRERTDFDGRVRKDGVGAGRYAVLSVDVKPADPDDEPTEGGDFDAAEEYAEGIELVTGDRVLLIVRRVDGASQAAVLVGAAEVGTPFCEECERPPGDLSAQAPASEPA